MWNIAFMTETQIKMLPHGNKILVQRCAWCAPWFANSPCVKLLGKQFDISHGICHTHYTVWMTKLKQKETSV